MKYISVNKLSDFKFHDAEFGAKPILILLTGTEIAKEFCILTMV